MTELVVRAETVFHFQLLDLLYTMLEAVAQEEDDAIAETAVV
jgi:hypothetical protein